MTTTTTTTTTKRHDTLTKLLRWSHRDRRDQLARRRGCVVARAAADDAAGDDAEDDGSVSMSDLVELEIGGVSVSERGFVALLVPKGCKDHIPRAKNQVEEMREGSADPSSELPEDIASRLTLPILVSQSTDTDGAISEWAQTLLQLLQTPPIDMGILLPYGALDELTDMEGSVLGAALIGRATFVAADAEADDDDRKYDFAATLLAGKEFEQNSFDVIGGAREAWRVLALALRYSPYGARIFATQEALRGVDAPRHYRRRLREDDEDDEDEKAMKAEKAEGKKDAVKGLTLGSVREVFPRLQTVNESRAIAAEARNMMLDPFLSGDDEVDDISSSSSNDS